MTRILDSDRTRPQTAGVCWQPSPAASLVPVTVTSLFHDMYWYSAHVSCSDISTYRALGHVPSQVSTQTHFFSEISHATAIQLAPSLIV